MIQLDLQGDLADVRGTVAATAYRTQADQIDRTINLSQVPGILGINPPGVPDRPALVVQKSSVWLQGILIGFEGKW